MRVGGWMVMALGVASCDRATVSTQADAAVAAPSSAVATWANEAITDDEVREAVGRLPIALRDRYDTPEGRRDFIDALISQRLLRNEAQRLNLHTRPDIQKQVRELEERLTTRALLDEAEKNLGPVSEAELKTYFERHADEFRSPLRVRITRVLATGPKNAATKKRAEAVRAKLLKTRDIAAIARTGDGPERLRDGDLGWISAASDDETTAAMNLPAVGSVSEVIPVPTGFSVLVATGREEPRVPPFEEVRGQINARVVSGRQRQAFDKLVTDLRAKANVKINAGAMP
ncbi:MAG: hypothetical protein DI536_31575 [Archangium gephyra]|uniref:peptidylprolyl isomerase n=1 Tax=Archangium gephyra TaxID=48 RepID=A0A2W5SYS1_9BACT|nr:MAG: hypothetical protein DI536_31575 [Archangium gephyra]